MAKADRSQSKTWNPQFLGRLLGAARHTRGTFSGVQKSDFWTAWILVAFQTGARPSEMFDIETEQIEADGGLKGHSLSDEAKAAVRKLVGTRKFLFGRLAPNESCCATFQPCKRRPSRGKPSGENTEIVRSSDPVRSKCPRPPNTFRKANHRHANYRAVRDRAGGPDQLRRLRRLLPPCFFPAV